MGSYPFLIYYFCRNKTIFEKTLLTVAKKAEKKNRVIAPFVKWVGGKRQLLTDIKEVMPPATTFDTYFEPFIGGGALFFDLEPTNAVINDYNQELINVYLSIKDDINTLVEDLKTHENTPEYFYRIRLLDREPQFDELTNVQKASRFIYLNKTCYNGLYRVNSAGQFNSPFGRYANPNIVNEPTLRAVSAYLNKSDIVILNTDYSEVFDMADNNSFVYIDPPYHPLSQTSNFTGYVAGGWAEKDQIRLKEACDSLNAKGVKFLLSNSSSHFIKELYRDYEIITVGAKRPINSDASQRGHVDEFLIKNY